MSMVQALDTFVTHYVQSHEQLITPYDADWPSDCEVGNAFDQPDGARAIRWQPVQRVDNQEDFAPLERALEIPIHDDIKAYYGRYWSANMEAEAPDGHVSLLFLWNRIDTDRLVENLIGHALACRQNRTPFSVFFACTEPDTDLFLTVNNETGAVQLEEPGRKPLRQVSDDLASFLAQLVPAKHQT